MNPGSLLQGPFLPLGHNLNNLCSRLIKWCYIPNIDDVGLVVFDKKTFLMYKPPWLGPFSPYGLFLTISLEDN